MDNNKKKASSSSSSSSTTNFDHLFGPKDPSTMSSSSTSIFGSIFPPPPSTVGGRDSRKQEVGFKNYGAPGNYGKGESSCGNKNETVEPSSYYSSSIYYGGQENYSPKTTSSSTRTTESHHAVNKLNLCYSCSLRKIRKMMIPMVTTQIAPQEETGGKVPFIIDTLHAS
ncbi:uncharacterized protein [Arachis hypogaea]|uniref:uncharacterized protein isoform X1 n=1 Tax=Arachis hypogaea TaxID=3818 RepID=UPI003B2253B6